MIIMKFKSIFRINFINNLMVNVIAASILIPKPLRVKIYKWNGIDFKGAEIAHRSFMGGSNIEIGQNTYINCNCFFDNLAKITIGKNCIIAMHVMFCTSTHSIKNDNGKVKIGDSEGKEIIIKDNCWIGTKATILPGVTIDEGCVIAAGAVVTKDCAPNGLYAGIPAKRIKDLI